MATGLRERKKADTRAALVAAARRLFGAQGYDATTVEDIAEAANVSARTFFRYFPTKEDVIFGDIDDRFTGLVGVLGERPAAEPPLRSLRNAVVALAAEYDDLREVVVGWSEIISANPALRSHSLAQLEAFEGALVETLRDRAPDEPVADLRLQAACFVAALRVAHDTWAQAGGTDDLVHVLTEALDTLERGFGP